MLTAPEAMLLAVAVGVILLVSIMVTSAFFSVADEQAPNASAAAASAASENARFVISISPVGDVVD
jgi:uncharacterized protein YpmB